MARHDWYRNKDWNDEIEAAFVAKFRRTRQPWSQWQYLTIQAGMIAAGHPDAARHLLEQSKTLASVEPGWVCISEQRLGTLAWKQNDEASAIAHLRASIATCAPGDRHIVGHHTPEAQLARILWMGNPDAQREAEALLGPAVAPTWPEIPNPVLDASEQPYASADDAAEGIVVVLHAGDELDKAAVDALFAADPAVLLAMDRLLVTVPTFRLFRAFWAHGRFELPAYIGRCAVRAGKANWVPGDDLLDWRLQANGQIIDPWSVAWPEIDRGTPLIRIYDRFCGA